MQNKIENYNTENKQETKQKNKMAELIPNQLH